MSFLAPLAFIAGLLAIPILLLYMLRLRRREVVVSSTFLWQQLLRDREANTPWQKLRRNLLMFLQLLTLALLVFALARPFIEVPAVGTGKIAVVLDASASMSTAENGETRLDIARRQALDMIDTLGVGNQMTIIRAAENAEVLASLTEDRAALRAAVLSAHAGSGSANWDEALTLAAANAGSGEDFTTVIISDGGGLGGRNGTATLPAIPGTLQYIPIGQTSDNVAITALAARALPGQSTELFAQITNYGDQDADVIFDLEIDGSLFTAERQTIPANSSLPIISRELPEAFTTVRAGITPPADTPTPNQLALDDSAYAVRSAEGARRVLITTEGNRFLEQVFRSLPGVSAFTVEPGRTPRSAYDIYVYDGWLPETLPAGDILIINPPQSTDLFTVGETLTRTDDSANSPTGNILVARDDPRMRFLDLSALNLLEFKQVTADWAEPLITAQGGPLLLAGETGGQQIAILTFDLRDSDLPLQIAYPILVASLLNWFTPQGIVQQPEASVGQPLTLTPPATADSLRVSLPDGSTRTLPVNTPTVNFTETGEIGLYRVDALSAGEVVSSGVFSVNLFDPTESAITPQTTITIGDEEITPQAEGEVGQREFWPLVALFALILLLIEWIIYHRRVRRPVQFKPLNPRPESKRDRIPA